MTDQAEKATAVISIGGDGASQLMLADKDHQERATLALRADGTPHLELSGKDAHGGASLVVTPSGAPILDLSDQAGKPRAVFGQVLLGNAAGMPAVHQGVPFSLTFVDRNGNVIRRVPR